MAAIDRVEFDRLGCVTVISIPYLRMNACLMAWGTLLMGAASAAEPAENWLGHEAVYPRFLNQMILDQEAFAALRADFVAGQLKVVWPGGPTDEARQVTLMVSEDEPGHWPSRDWRALPMTRRGETWEARLAVVDVDVPSVYFVALPAEEAEPVQEGAVCSPMRVCWPRRLGMEQPTRSFFPFLEGFEEPLLNWHMVGDAQGKGNLRVVTESHTGKGALAVTIPPGQSSVKVLTTRVRGWQAVRQGASGVRLWLKAGQGRASARFVLLAQAGSTNELAAMHAQVVPLNHQWQDVNLAFGDFTDIPLVSVDALAIETFGEESSTILIDDLQLIGPWRLID